MAFFSNQLLCVRKEALGTRLSKHALLLGFKTQQEQTALIWQGVGKTVARVWKKNIQAEVKYRKIRISYQHKRCFILSESRSDI